MVGQQIKEYKIISKIGKGGMGRVFLAEHSSLGKFVLKLLPSDLATDERFRSRFLRETQAQIALQHENIISLHPPILENDMVFIVQEYVDGQSLAKIISIKGRLPEKTAIIILCQVLEGLGHAHGKGITHHDLKPANVIVSKNNMIKISDFGIALMIGDYRLTQTGISIGTSHYMGPEQINSPRQLDHRTDIYAAGIMLYEMLTGKPPFIDPNVFTIFQKHLYDPPPKLTEPSFLNSMALSAIVAKALAKKPEDRYEFCADFIADLETYLSTKPSGNDQPTQNTGDSIVEQRLKIKGEEGLTAQIFIKGLPTGEIMHQIRNATFSPGIEKKSPAKPTESSIPVQSMASSVFSGKASMAKAYGRPVRSDIEGDLIHVDDPQSHFAKHLPLNYIWHINFGDLDLYDAFESWCTSVDISIDDIVIHYFPGLQPTNLIQIRSELRFDLPLVQWRLAILTKDLCTSLREILNKGIPQLLIHPERIAVGETGFMILPTLAGLNPPLSGLEKDQNLGWLFYSAPEVVRTRFAEPRLSPAAEVYSMGRTLQLVAAFDCVPPVIIDGLKYLQSLVEDLAVMSLPSDGIDFQAFWELTDRMSAPLSNKRPDLETVIEQASSWIEQYAPEAIIRTHIQAGEIDNADACLKAVKACNRGPFTFPMKTFHILCAELEFSRTPQNFQKALDHLNRSLQKDKMDADIYKRIAMAYESFTAHEQHMQLSAEAYKSAAELSGWPQDIMEGWTRVLQDLPPHRIVADTSNVPKPFQPKEMVLLRVKSLMSTGQLENTEKAWGEIVSYGIRFGMDVNLHNLARKVAGKVNPHLLLASKSICEKTPELKPLEAVIWERNGNTKKMIECLEKAPKQYLDEWFLNHRPI